MELFAAHLMTSETKKKHIIKCDRSGNHSILFFGYLFMFGLALFLQPIIINAMKNDVKCVDDVDDVEGKPAQCCQHSRARTDNNGWTNAKALKSIHNSMNAVCLHREYRSLAGWLWSSRPLSPLQQWKQIKMKLNCCRFLFCFRWLSAYMHYTPPPKWRFAQRKPSMRNPMHAYTHRQMCDKFRHTCHRSHHRRQQQQRQQQ